VKRRFEYVLRSSECTIIDDYAHHPEELNAAIATAKAIFPDKRITGVFQPHLYSRTRDFMQEFAQSLDQLHEIILLDIYPARELPIEGITSEALLKLCKNPNKQLSGKRELINRLQEMKPEVLLILGAGDIDALVEPIKNMLINQNA
jgi:UDP-N-acetylmuramate--alanine ligase